MDELDDYDDEPDRARKPMLLLVAGWLLGLTAMFFMVGLVASELYGLGMLLSSGRLVPAN
jgi:hypothetical protein